MLNKKKNKEGKKIIVVSEDAQMGLDTSQQLTKRGTNNIHYLSCGILSFLGRYPELLVGNEKSF